MGDDSKDGGFICYTCRDAGLSLFVLGLYNDFLGYTKDPNKEGGFFNKESMKKLKKELKENPDKYKYLFKKWKLIVIDVRN